MNGKNIDFKVANSKGSSIVVVVKKITAQETTPSIDSLLNIPLKTLESYYPSSTMKLLKRGPIFVDHVKGIFLLFATSDLNITWTLYQKVYNFYYRGYVYVITESCDTKNQAQMELVFFESLQSFTFPE